MSDCPPRIAIVGGGLAGLSAAHRLTELAAESGRPIDVTLFEASSRLGGAIETVRENGYLIERGADSFLTSKPAAVRLCERLGLADELIPTDERFRGALVLRNGKPIPIPDGFNLMVPGRLGPVLMTPALSLSGKFRMLAEVFIPARRDGSDESLSSFVRRRFGDEAFDRLVQPLVSGIYTADPDKLSLAATLPRFLDMERRHGGLIRATLASGRRQPPEHATGARYGLFAGLRNGMEQLFTALKDRVGRQATVHVSMPATAVRREEAGWRIETASSSDAGLFDAAILALPAYRSAALLADADNELASLLRRIPYASSAIVVSGHRLSDVTHPLDAFGLIIPTIERRDVIAVSFASRKFPGRAADGRVLLRTFIGGATRPEMLERSDEELVALVRTELASLLGVSGMPEVTLVTRYDQAMPQYHVGHLDLVTKIESATARHAGLKLTGSAYRGVGIPDVIADAEQAAEAVFARRTRESSPAA